MKRLVLAVCVVAVACSLAVAQSAAKRKTYPVGGSYPSGAKLTVVPDLNQRLAQFQQVSMPFNKAALSPREVQLVNKLVEAARAFESIYWRQNDPDAITLYQQLRGSNDPRDKAILRYVFINGGRFDLIHENQPFVGVAKFSPGRGLYPQELTRADIEAYVKAHPEKKDEIYSPYTVIRRRGDELESIPYFVAYRPYLEAGAKALREAATLSDDKAFADFLRARAEALLSDDYYKSDLLWVDLKNPKFDVIYAPYETYLDDILGVKTSFGATVMIRNEAESKKLSKFQEFVPNIQEALPLAVEDRPDKHGQPSPMEVVDAPYRSGDLLHGYQAVADNLPNDPRVHQEKGTKKIFFKNFMDARVNYVILPVARRLMRADQARKATADGYLTIVMMHEICHGLGPAFARTTDGKRSIREAIGPTYSALEEAKADVTGMFGVKWLIDHGALPKDRLQDYYASYLAGILRSVRFGVAEAHGRAQMMEFNYLVEKGAISRVQVSSNATTKGATPVSSWRYIVDDQKMTDGIASLTKELLEIEATGDRMRAENWFAKYDKMPADMKASLDGIKGVPVDIFPSFSFAEVVK